VTDHCQAIQLVLEKGRLGESYAVGGETEKTNLDLVRILCRALDQKHPRKNGLAYEQLIQFVADRPGHDQRYAIDPKKIREELGFSPATSFEEGLQKTVDWYLNFYLKT
jgi:dTDP-glucose 4,6-dehydratase